MSPSFLSIGGIIIDRQGEIDHQERFVYPTAKAVILQYARLRERVRDTIRQVCREMGVTIIRGVLSKDHGHMFVSVLPSVPVSKLMQKAKGRSSFKVQQEFPEIKKRYWGRRFWARGYFCATSGAITDQAVLQYIDSHADKPTDASR